MNILLLHLIKQKYIRTFLLLALTGTIVLAAACSKEEQRKNPSSNDPAAASTNTQSAILPKYVNITKKAGISFVHNNAAFGAKYLPESIASGCAFLDYNNDGNQDIFLVNFKDWPERKRKASYPALYKNNGDGTFSDVTSTAGLSLEMYGLGVASADYDNDGHMDIFVSCLDQDHLYHNNGNGTFSDMTEAAGIREKEFGTSSTWFDYDRDGFVDLYVCNYVKWTKETDLFCTLDGVNKSY